MSKISPITMRVLHRYLGFFLAGIMFIYSVSGIVLIFRTTDFLKKEIQNHKELVPGLDGEKLGKELKMREFKSDKVEGDIVYFKNGTYNKATGVADYTTKELPFFLDKMTKLHKANTNSPLYFLNIFFGLSLLFFVISTFWMYRPSTKIFKNGIAFTIAGIILTLVLLFV
ncbi:MAG: hypothetical protein IPP61_09705 [Cytophagaceae bacterium]|jgi:uncharacterized iron-regulated membrane protein|nr:hypothetical protein [Cytophagaceae bacterium]MBL0325439.1 hypothetical protein [Cytophagaceae bacterium]